MIPSIVKWLLIMAGLGGLAHAQLQTIEPVRSSSFYAIDDELTIAMNTPVEIPVLFNELETIEDPELPPVMIVGVTQGSNGSVVIVPGPHNTVRYTPNQNFQGTDTFTYIATSGSETASASVIVKVEPFSTLTVPAFPGAQGPGAVTRHGRGGKVIYVDNLNDSGAGSFRAAVTAAGPRIVAFKIGGTIALQSRIDVENPFLYIAGQSAPGGGITLTRFDGDDILRIRTHDVLVRHIRFRNGRRGQPGSAAGRGQLSITARGQNIMIDHISQSWNWDDNGLWINTTNLNEGYGFPIYNQTWQNSIFAEAFDGHSTGFIIGGDMDLYGDKTGTPFQMGRYISKIALHHNLFLNTSHRLPRGQSKNTQIINNVVYNWEHRIGNTLVDAQWDYINNYYRPGPMTDVHYLLHEGNVKGDLIRLYHRDSGVTDLPSLYISGNIFAPDGDTLLRAPNQNQWDFIRHSYDSCCWSRYTPLPADWRRQTPLAPAPIPIAIQTAWQAYNTVLSDVGANRQLLENGCLALRQDAVDVRLINEVKTNTGTATFITDENEVGGFPSLASGIPYPDSDADGMADEFEILNGFNPNDGTDGPLDRDGDGYTNVEEFLNGSHATYCPPPDRYRIFDDGFEN